MWVTFTNPNLKAFMLVARFDGPTLTPSLFLSLSLTFYPSFTCSLSPTGQSSWPMAGSEMKTFHFLLLDKTCTVLRSWTSDLQTSSVSVHVTEGVSACGRPRLQREKSSRSPPLPRPFSFCLQCGARVAAAAEFRKASVFLP